VYGPIAEGHLKQPRNLGKLDDADGVGQVDDPDTETLLTIYLKLGAAPDGHRLVVDARFRAFGCGGCIVTGSVVTELVIGRSLGEAAVLEPRAVHRAVADGLPPDQRYCADLAIRALRLAVESAGAGS
jgi:nitrogen fixation NifU-like protein